MRLPGITGSFAFALAILVGAGACGEIQLPAIFSDNMAVQRDARTLIWGSSGPGDSVTVILDTQTAKCTADLNGRWRASLDTRALGDGPFNLEVKSRRPVLAQGGHYSRTVRNVIVGDVWLCVGGTYMNGPLADGPDANVQIAAARYPAIRLFRVEPAVAQTPAQDVAGRWETCDPTTIRDFSALAYSFGKHLHRTLATPVGLIQCSANATPLEVWTGLDVLSSDADFSTILARYEEAKEGFSQRMMQYRRAMADWHDKANAAGREDGNPPPQPARPFGPGHPRQPGGRYNGMIAPLASLSIAGVLWCQGEYDARKRSPLYPKLFPAMIRDWRREWGVARLPFIYAQLPNHGPRTTPSSDSRWARLREAQLAALALPETAMAVTIDLGHPTRIQPPDRRAFALRLARLAEAAVYGRSAPARGPTFTERIIEGNAIRLRFNHVEGGLVSRDGPPLRGFTVAGNDRSFVSATAAIEANTVVVSSERVPHPVAVRYAWADNPDCNLYNNEGLPARPFRTDNWPPPPQTLNFSRPGGPKPLGAVAP